MSGGSSSINFRSQVDQSPENEFADDQSNIDQFPEFLMFDEWLDEDHPAVSMVSDSMPNPVNYPANEVDEYSGGSSSHLGGQTSSKYTYDNS